MEMEKYNILPTDSYIVVNKSIINDEDRKILNMLYQPIIGPLPVMLYYLFWSDLERSELISVENTHHHIITNMKVSASEFLSLRRTLEAIGLLKVYVKKDSINNYIYELFSPLSAHDFFNHPILNIIIYNNVGKKEYERLVNYFKIKRVSTNGFEDITASFSDVFESVPLASYDIANDNIRKINHLKLNINTNFDLNFLISSMPKNINLNKIFTKDNKELILNLAFIYEIDAVLMGEIIKGCINEKGLISKEELRKTCRNHYSFDHGGILPTIIDHSQPEHLRKVGKDDSKRAKMIYTFETVSPFEFLKSKNSGGEPMKRDLKLAEDLIIDYGLKPGVVNVLLDYVLKTNNNKLTRNMVETIAGQWKRLKIETVEDAMNLAEKEYKKYKNKNIQRKVVGVKKEEKIPEWFDKKIEKQEFSVGEVNEIEEILKEYK